MLVSYNWLKEYVDIDKSAQDLAEMITRAGVEIASVEPTNKGVTGVVVAEVKTCVDHPNSDHLHICTVTTDGENTIQVVCGAPNVAAGQRVMFAMAGATLPGGKIKKSKFRGEESNGMICSMQEIGVPDELVCPLDKDGIRILPEDAPLGADVMEYLGMNDYVLDVDLTPNRSDCLSVYNIAREVGALLHKPVRPIEIPEVQGSGIEDYMKVSIEDPSRCHRYTGMMIKGAKTGRSPLWMEHRLQCAGMRPISNLVDVTNYVMMELGQPLHAFDYNMISGHEINVRTAKPGEHITTLDGNDRALSEEMLLICDKDRAVGVAGVMGGENTEIKPETKDVFIESAYFDPINIRRTSVAMGLRTEASIRYEKNVDMRSVEIAGRRAADLMVKISGAEQVGGMIDVYPTKHEPVYASLKYAYANALLGTDIPYSEMRDILVRLGFKPVEEDEESIRVEVPSWRPDCSIAEDLVEEIARLYGYDNIPEALPFGATNPGVLTPRQLMLDHIKRILVSLGLDEVVTYSFINPNTCDKLRWAQDDPRRNQIKISNPLTEEMSVMRTSMLPCMLETIASNVNRQNTNLGFFECSSVFFSDHELTQENLASEQQHLVIALKGNTRRDWLGTQIKYNFFYLKGILETLLNTLHITNYSVEAVKDDPTWHPGRTAALYIGDQRVGIFGEVHPLVTANYGMKDDIYAAEISLETILAIGESVPILKKTAKFPAVPRDLAIVVNKDVAVDDLIAAITEADPDNLTRIDVFDVYEGDQLAPDKKSIAFSLIFQSDEQTLTDEMVQNELEKIVSNVKQKCGGELRA
jgi:phenylalanyl-tRNA synthetase beta chain